MKSVTNDKIKQYKGIDYLIIKNPHMDFYLAYIKLPKNHPWHKESHYDNIPLEVHGGLTFLHVFTGTEKGDENWWGFSKGKWAGWDYGHFGDYMDIGGLLENGKRWTYDEVADEVFLAINQLLEKGGVN